MREHWIPAQTSPGMFSSECAVLLSTADGTEVSFFIDKSLVDSSGSPSKIKVTLIEHASTEERQRILLPTETFETQTCWVDIKAV